MNTVLISTAYIQELLDSDPNIECIEVWARVLYARMKKGCGRNKFISKKGLEFSLPVYYYESNYISIIKRYHPDTSGQSRSGLSKQSTGLELSKNINLSRQPLSRLFTGRRCDGISFVRSHDVFTKFTSTKQCKKAGELMERLLEHISETRYGDGELFGGYINNPLGKEGEDALKQVDNKEKVLQNIIEAMSNRAEELRKEDPEWADIEDEAAQSLGF